MAKKYNNFRVGGSPHNVNEDYAVWTNDLLERVIASKQLFILVSLPKAIN